jgi:hypothetical protein
MLMGFARHRAIPHALMVLAHQFLDENTAVGHRLPLERARTIVWKVRRDPSFELVT